MANPKNSPKLKPSHNLKSKPKSKSKEDIVKEILRGIKAMQKAQANSPAEPLEYTCSCEYSKCISSSFDEAFDSMIDNNEHAEEYHSALMHSDRFQGMLAVTQDEEMDIEVILSDAVRFGMEAGRRMSEVNNLEKMVGM